MSNFPTSLDDSTSLPNPTATSKTNSPSHSNLHTEENAAIIAAETKIGTGSSTPASNTILRGTGAGTSEWSGLTSAQLAAILSNETGSGLAVFGTSPTLVTPSVDTINESTPANGVTVDSLNIKDGKLNTNNSVVTANVTDLAVTTAKIAADAVTATKIDWASTGADAGIWWEELGRTTLSGAGDTISVTSLPARKYLRIIASASGTNIRGTWQFNTDTGSNYAYRVSDDGGAGATGTATTSIPLGDAGANNVRIYAVIDVINITALEKLVNGMVVTKTTAGDGTAPSIRSGAGTWDNTIAQISSVQFVNTSTGDFAIGSEVVVLGHN